MKIYLASQSPRRQELLQQINIEFEVIDVDIDESWNRKENPEDYTCRMAIEKAREANKKNDKKLPVLAADTAVMIDDIILGKAETAEDAQSMLEQLSGNTHQVLSAVALVTDQEQCLLNTSIVTFDELTDDEIRQYCESNEPIGKAGGYAIQGKAAGFITHLDGSYSGVMGLPLYETQQLLNSLIN